MNLLNLHVNFKDNPCSLTILRPFFTAELADSPSTMISSSKSVSTNAKCDYFHASISPCYPKSGLLLLLMELGGVSDECLLEWSTSHLFTICHWVQLEWSTLFSSLDAESITFLCSRSVLSTGTLLCPSTCSSKQIRDYFIAICQCHETSYSLGICSSIAFSGGRFSGI